jgi:hypothetical protein
MSNPSIGGISTTVNTVVNQLRLVPVYIPISATIQGVKWVQITKNATASTGFNGFALFSYNGTGTLTNIAQTADDVNIFNNANLNVFNSVPFTTSPSLAAGVYFITVLYNSSAGASCTIAGVPSNQVANQNSFDFANGIDLSFTLGVGLTFMPPSFAINTTAVNNLNPALYLY